MTEKEETLSWFAGRRSDVERLVGETCNRAIASMRGVLADEIRGLSRRVERMHDLLDQLEHLVEKGDDEGDAVSPGENDSRREIGD